MIQQQPLRSFCVYAQQDLPLWEELRCHLSVLRRQELIASWYEWQYDGETQLEKANNALSNAQIILLFINSKFVSFSRQQHKVIREVVEMSKKGAAFVFPILSSDMGIYESIITSQPIFNQFTFFPNEVRALTSWGDKEEALCAQTRYILLLARAYQAAKFLPEGGKQRLDALGQAEMEAKQKALSEWSEYQVWSKEHIHTLTLSEYRKEVERLYGHLDDEAWERLMQKLDLILQDLLGVPPSRIEMTKPVISQDLKKLLSRELIEDLGNRSANNDR